MGVAGVFGLINTRIIIGHFGTGAYAQNGLLATFPSLMPFTDLGIGAVILNTVAGSEGLPRDAVVRRTLTTAVRVLLISSLVIATATLFYSTAAISQEIYFAMIIASLIEALASMILINLIYKKF